MSSGTTFTRPTLSEALNAWETILTGQGRSRRLRWLFEENLCFEKSPAAPDGFHFAFQTRFTPLPDDALDIAFDNFAATKARVVLYRVGDCRGESLCVLLCDPWLERQGEADGFVRRDDWGLSFCPGLGTEVEEITDLGRWLKRVKRGRRPHELDFCMTLAAIEEIKAYGRPLAPYERYAQALLNRLRRFLGQPA